MWEDDGDGDLEPGEFTSYDDGSDTVFSTNLFKKLKGLGGMFLADESTTLGADETPLQQQHIIVVKSVGTIMGDASTDEDGWYYTEFMATGKMTDYTVWWDQNDDGNWDDEPLDNGKVVQMGGKAGKWAQVDFTMVDPIGYDPLATLPDYVIDSYDEIQ